MFTVAMFGVLVTMSLVLVRAIKGPTVYDRVLAANSFGTATILLIAVAGFLTGRPEWLDLAILYAIVNFTGTIAVAKYARFGELADDRRVKDEQRRSAE